MSRAQSIGADLYTRMQQRLYEEARLLDEERFDDWLNLLTDDVRYILPLPERRFRKDRTRQTWTAYIFDDDKEILQMRIARLKSGYVWSEDPHNNIRHLVNNVEVYPGDDRQTLRVNSVVEIHRSRLDGEEKRLIATRTDQWRAVGEDYYLARREGLFCHALVLDSNLNLFF